MHFILTERKAGCQMVLPTVGSCAVLAVPAVVLGSCRALRRVRAQAAAKEATWVDLKHTTSVYVQGLPDDVTEAEMVQARPA